MSAPIPGLPAGGPPALPRSAAGNVAAVPERKATFPRAGGAEPAVPRGRSEPRQQPGTFPVRSPRRGGGQLPPFPAAAAGAAPRPRHPGGGGRPRVGQSPGRRCRGAGGMVPPGAPRPSRGSRLPGLADLGPRRCRALRPPPQAAAGEKGRAGGGGGDPRPGRHRSHRARCAARPPPGRGGRGSRRHHRAGAAGPRRPAGPRTGRPFPAGPGPPATFAGVREWRGRARAAPRPGAASLPGVGQPCRVPRGCSRPSVSPPPAAPGPVPPRPAGSPGRRPP